MAVLLHLLPLLVAVVVLAFVIHAVFWGMTFRVDDAHVRVLVYGLTVRKVALADIAYADRSCPLWNEHYTSSLDRKKVVCLRRRTGWIKNFIITPSDPEVFIAQLRERGVECALGRVSTAC
ncbi:hypothetical protein EMGBS8_05700 [Verrucomicrobiota bacterium]|nr:hypothetical protein EMGBS8_05700 [Verrucomicrobiota bacterium]